MDFEIWNYPHVDTLIHQQNPDETPESLIDNQPDEPELSPEEINRQQELLAHTQALTNHLNLIGEISRSLSEKRHEINETFLTNITLLIKKITETVIRKELSMDLNHERLTTLIKQAIADIQQDNEPCVIHIATEQHEYFSSLDSMPSDITFKACPTLKPGDFRIKTAFSELESVLDNHLHDLFGLQRE